MSKLTNEELKKLNDTSEVEAKLAAQLGVTEFQITALRDNKKQLIETMAKKSDERQKYLQELREKYNIESLNVDTGEFTVTK